MPRAPKIKPAVISLGTRLTPTQAQRVAEAQRLLSQLLPIGVIHTKLMEKYQFSKQRAIDLITLARKVWATEEEADRAALKTETVNAYKMFYNQAMAKEAYAPARQAIRDLSILHGVNPEANAHARIAGALEEAVDAIDPDRVRARIDELVAKRAQKGTP